MTPSVAEVMRGCAAALAQPPSPDAGPEFFASSVGMISMLANLAAQEAEHAAAAAVVVLGRPVVVLVSVEVAAVPDPE